ncbi:uncharacterized protein [Macrobrachium rosenbergii]|uniref:uncharacterized protein n=1 Tax=Macrobrachium rosenbergii TaxID=79674 RepID=UPI0034D7A518
MMEASTSACTVALLSSWISCFGVPDNITTDRRLAFLSEHWVSLARLVGTTLHSTEAYNPASNGMVERTHRSLKAALMARCTDDNWKAQLPWVLLDLRTAPRANSDESPAEKVYGKTLAASGEFFPTEPDIADTPLPRLREIAQRLAPCRKTFADSTHVYSPKGLYSCTHIFIRIDAHHPPEAHTVSLVGHPRPTSTIHRREDWVSVDRLKPAFLMDNGTGEETGRRPRIPPQNEASVEPTGIPKQGRGHPKGCTKEVICSAKPSGNSAVEAAPHPQVSRTRGWLLLPKGFCD